MRGGPEEAVRGWLAALDGVPPQTLPTQLNQKDLRQWRLGHGWHRSFTVVRHPLARAHAVFCRRILSQEPGSFARIRKLLRNFHKLPIPGGEPGPDYDRAAHSAAFVAFLEFLQANLAGQTGIRVDPHWTSQAVAIEGMASVALPDRIIREEEMTDALTGLARDAGYRAAPAPGMAQPDTPHALADIYDERIERLAARVYERDYLIFGFGAWG